MKNERPLYGVGGGKRQAHTILTTPHREDKKNNLSKTYFKPTADFTCNICISQGKLGKEARMGEKRDITQHSFILTKISYVVTFLYANHFRSWSKIYYINIHLR